MALQASVSLPARAAACLLRPAHARLHRLATPLTHPAHAPHAPHAPPAPHAPRTHRPLPAANGRRRRLFAGRLLLRVSQSGPWADAVALPGPALVLRLPPGPGPGPPAAAPSPRRHVAERDPRSAGGEPAGLVGGAALQQQRAREQRPGLGFHVQRGHGEDTAGRPARVRPEQLQELALRQPASLTDPTGYEQSVRGRQPQHRRKEQLPVGGGLPGEEEGGGEHPEEKLRLDLGLVESAGERAPQGVPAAAPAAHGRAQHAQHQRHEAGRRLLRRVPQGLPPVPAAVAPAGHRPGDLHRTAPDHLHQHLLMTSWSRLLPGAGWTPELAAQLQSWRGPRRPHRLCVCVL